MVSSGSAIGTVKKMDDRESPQVEVETQLETDNAVERGRGRRRAKAAATDASVNMGELREIIELIRENDFTEFELEREGFRVRFRRGVDPDSTEASATAIQAAAASGTIDAKLATDAASTPGAPSHPGAKAETEASEDLGLHIINSPIVGTFYRAASPNADSFVKIGSRVEQETVVCIIEAMKLMNEIQAETSGEVAKIYVENGQPVEYGQPLFGIKQ